MKRTHKKVIWHAKLITTILIISSVGIKLAIFRTINLSSTSQHTALINNLKYQVHKLIRINRNLGIVLLLSSNKILNTIITSIFFTHWRSV